MKPFQIWDSSTWAGWGRVLLSLRRRKPRCRPILPVNVTFVTESLGVNEPLDFKRGSCLDRDDHELMQTQIGLIWKREILIFRSMPSQCQWIYIVLYVSALKWKEAVSWNKLTCCMTELSGTSKRASTLSREAAIFTALKNPRCSLGLF